MADQFAFDWEGSPEQEAKFAAHHAANPEMWTLFVRFSFEKIGRGFAHYGARDIIHRIRWETDASESGEAGFKVNNIWSPWYARLFHRTYPQHAGFFRTRIARADQEAA